jgi:hypothetical protein
MRRGDPTEVRCYRVSGRLIEALENRSAVASGVQLQPIDVETNLLW